jgi:phosphotransferase system  glucose/maltose/N-acetylglucosamine-specific IIC component
VKTLRARAAVFGHSHCVKRIAKICFGLIAGVLLLQFYYVRELVFMQAAAALGFAVATLIVALYALGYIAVVWLRKLGAGLKALGAHVSVRHRQPFAKTTVTGLTEAKEEVS